MESHEALRPARVSALWNVWYASYDAAKKHVHEHGGYLLPYQKQFFVCDKDYITSLGLRLDDPDLVAVGVDWVKLRDSTAWDRLLVKIARANSKA